jgi:pimeloyl-ACP methyl ester carboxylesterase
VKRRWKVVITVGVVLALLLAVNTVVVDSETKPAAITADDGTIVELSSVDLQLVDMPPKVERLRAQGAPIVLLHGYATSLHWFEQLAPLLNQRHRVIALDLIGHGGSQKPKSGFTIPEQATAVAEALSSLGIEGATVVGHSMGGYVAAELAEQASQLVDRVVVLGTPASADGSSLPFLARLTYAPVLGQAIWRARFPALVKSEYESAFAPGFDLETAFGNPDQVVEDNDAMTFSSYDGAGAGGRDFIEAESMVSRLTRAAVPFLAVLGAEDQIVDTELSEEEYGGVPGAEIRVFDGVGHSPHLEAPADTAELILRFAGAAPTPAEIATARKRAQQSQAESRPGSRADAN